MATSICPICKSAAEKIEDEQFDGKTFCCPKHGKFQVAATVLSSLSHMNASSNEWEAALKTASENAIEGTSPRILEFDFHELPRQSPPAQLS